MLAVLVFVASAVQASLPPPDLFGGGRLVVYAPRGFDPTPGWKPRARRLRADATALLALGVRAVETEGTPESLRPVCRFLKRHGIVRVIIGVADPTDASELRRAATLRRCADGYAIGWGGLAEGRYGREVLARAVERLRRRTGKPVAVRERPESYEKDPTLLGLGDWVFPLVDPLRDEMVGPQESCGSTMQEYRDVLERAPIDRPVTIAATGLPTSGSPGANDTWQRAYLLCLESRNIPFAIFEAFDQPWRQGAEYYGLLRADGAPKLWATQLSGTAGSR